MLRSPACLHVVTQLCDLLFVGNYNPLERVIKAASNDSNYSWCTCSEEICTEQLRGFVQWNMNGRGWKVNLWLRADDTGHVGESCIFDLVHI